MLQNWKKSHDDDVCQSFTLNRSSVVLTIVSLGYHAVTVLKIDLLWNKNQQILFFCSFLLLPTWFTITRTQSCPFCELAFSMWNYAWCLCRSVMFVLGFGILHFPLFSFNALYNGAWFSHLSNLNIIPLWKFTFRYFLIFFPHQMETNLIFFILLKTPMFHELPISAGETFDRQKM